MSSRLTEADTHFGARIRTRRLLLGMTQEELGAAIGVSFQQIQKYERGQNRICASRLLDVADVLDVSPTYFFDGLLEGPEHRSHKDEDLIGDFLSSKEGISLAAAWLHVDDPGARRSMLELVQAFARKPARVSGARAK